MLVDLGGCCIDSGATLLDAFAATLNEIEALAELPKWCWQHATRLVEVMKRLLNCMSVSSKLVGELRNIRVIHYGSSVTLRRPGIAKVRFCSEVKCVSDQFRIKIALEDSYSPSSD